MNRPRHAAAARSRMRSARARQRLGAESLERRLVPAGFSLTPDIVNVQLPGDAESFPTADIDVLANDSGTGLRISAVSAAMVGSVEQLTGPDGRDLLRYVPGLQFRGYDAFVYCVTDAFGREEWQSASVGYEQDAAAFEPWSIVAASTEVPLADPPGLLTAADGSPLLAVTYAGMAEYVTVGVLLRWDAAGSVAPTVAADTVYYPQFNGYAWIYGTIADVNAVLASLAFVPDAEAAAPAGFRLSAQAHLYSSLGINVGVQFADVVVGQVVDDSGEAGADRSGGRLPDELPLSAGAAVGHDGAFGGHLDPWVPLEPAAEQSRGEMPSDWIDFAIASADPVDMAVSIRDVPAADPGVDAMVTIRTETTASAEETAGAARPANGDVVALSAAAVEAAARGGASAGTAVDAPEAGRPRGRIR